MRSGILSMVVAVLAVALLPQSAVAQEGTQPAVMEGLPEHLIYLYSDKSDGEPAKAMRQLYATSRRWEPGRTLRVCLFGGNDVVARLIRQSASEWNSYSGVKLDFGPVGGWHNCLAPQSGFFQIRIGFSSNGYWSMLGNDSETRVDAYSPSMNLQAFNRLYSPDRMQANQVMDFVQPYHVAAIKHEFGHALGLLHEHQNPSLGCQSAIKWEGPGNVYEYFAGSPNFWSADQVQRNLGFIGQTDPDFVSGAPDPKSIMMYALPEAVFKDGRASACFVSVNYAISEKDKQIIARIYPSATQAAVNDINLSGVSFRPLAASASPIEVADTRERVVAALESEDAFIRRDARARLADMLGKLAPPDVTTLIESTSTGSYRAQLGVAVAVANAPSGFKLSTTAKSLLANGAKTAKDATLKKQFDLATKR